MIVLYKKIDAILLHPANRKCGQNKHLSTSTYNFQSEICILQKSYTFMSVGINWIFRRGQKTIKSKNFDLEPFLKVRMDNSIEAK